MSRNHGSVHDQSPKISAKQSHDLEQNISKELSQTKGHAKQNHHNHDPNSFNALKIPCDWVMAKKHGDSRRVAIDIEGEGIFEQCECCGYQIEKQELPYDCDPIELRFLGSGFPLFYSFIKFCIFILFQFLLFKGIFCLSTDLMGDYCQKSTKVKGQQEEHIHSKSLGKQDMHSQNEKIKKNLICPDDFWHYISIANVYDRSDIRDMQTNLSLVVVITNMITLLFFRKTQRQIDIEIDESQLTPSDYTLCIKNIPKSENGDYKEELKKIFTYYAVQGKELEVTKIVLVYDIEELIELEEELKKIILNKQNALKSNNMDFSDEAIRKIDEEIEHLEHQIHQLEHKLSKDPKKFAGIAFISFLTEDMKEEVLQYNTHTHWERVRAFWAGGRHSAANGSELMIGDNKLYVEQAPEPNDVDWEFVHVPTSQKIKYRIMAWSISITFMVGCFFTTWILTYLADKMTDKVNEQEEKGIHDFKTALIAAILSSSISWTIIFFNKFVIGKVYHLIVDMEKISNKTKFNISFAQKQSVALFINTALISLVIDFFITGNIIGEGGFIFNETNVFLLNAFIPPIVWFVDPWSLQMDYRRNKELNNLKQSVLTQQQANELMENPDYSQAKRYGDIMKTMWFTFFYGDIIPVGILFSILGLSLYYFVDKFNVLRRRTIKENLSKDLSIEMIEMLELIILFQGTGNLIVSYVLFDEIHWQDVLIITISFLYGMLPMEQISEMIFPIQTKAEEDNYWQAQEQFDTDYDRENPVTKKEAMSKQKK